MKKIIIILLLMLICVPVYAADNTFYYDSERVEEMWITKVNSEETRSAHPYIIKRRSDNTYVYCLEPFVLLQNDVEYITGDISKLGLSEDQVNNINLFIYYGYGYGNHTTDKWYGVTQYLIWKESDKNADIYFTSTKNGKKEDLYRSEINEIYALIAEHNKQPNFLKDYVISTNDVLKIDSNIDLSNYEIYSTADYELTDNKLIFKNLSVGDYQVSLKRKNNRYQNEYLLFFHKDSQNIIVPGNSPIYDKGYNFNISVKEGEIVLKKYSTYNNKYLSGATYGVYDNDKLVRKITTGNTSLSIYLPFGTYKIKELQAPAGYKLDPKEYTITIDKDHLKQELKLYNDKVVVNVPDTGKNNYLKYSSISLFVVGLVLLIYDKKKNYLY